MTTIIKDTRGKEKIMEYAIHEAGHYILLRRLRDIDRQYFRRMIVEYATVDLRCYGGAGQVQAKLIPWERFSLNRYEEAKGPALMYILGGLAGETLWRNLNEENIADKGIEDLDPRKDQIWVDARSTFSTWEREVIMKREAKVRFRQWEIAHDIQASEPRDEVSSDAEKVRALIGDLDWEPYYLKALDVVHKHWPAVLRVGKALVEKRTINAKEAHLAFAGQG